MNIKYYGKAKNFNDKELVCGGYYVGVGDTYTSKDGVVYTCIENSPAGYLDVMCYFKTEKPLEMEGNVAIPKIWFFLNDFFGG